MRCAAPAMASAMTISHPSLGVQSGALVLIVMLHKPITFGGVIAGMIRYFIRRLLWASVLLFAVTLVTYVIFFIVPADPARLACGQRATQSCVERASKFLGTDKPVYVQYGRFLKRLVVDHSLGRSFTNRQDVNHVILSAAPVTASIIFGGVL